MKLQKRRTLSLVLAALLAGTVGAQAAESNLTKAPQPVNGCFVDRYKTNIMDNQTPENNAVIDLFSDFLNIWKPGDMWNNGTKLNAKVLDQNIAIVKAFTEARTEEQNLSTYFEERRSQSYSVIDGLGVYTPSYMKYSRAKTTIPTLPEDAATKKYSDKGNEAGDFESPLGPVSKLVKTLRGKYSSGNPSKVYYQYMRPFRWDESIKVNPYLVSSISKKVQEDGGFASGHTNAAYLAAIGIAYSYPERYQEMLTRAAELGTGRIIAGKHSCLDVMGGRMMGLALAASILSEPENAQLKADAYKAAHDYLRADMSYQDRYGDYAKNKQEYTKALTYGFKQIGDKHKQMTVPKGAEVLLETRQPYLDADQRRMVLYTTGIESGYPLLDDQEGWGRLNLFAAADGYAAFPEDVTVNMDASKGGFSAHDIWRNDISGTGALIKEGTGELALAGNNSYTGGTRIMAGKLTAASDKSLGKGSVMLAAGTLSEDVEGRFDVGGTYRQSPEGILVLTVAGKDDIMQVKGKADVSGKLIIKLDKKWKPASQTLIKYRGGSQGKFQQVEIEGLPANVQASVVQAEDKVVLQVK